MWILQIKMYLSLEICKFFGKIDTYFYNKHVDYVDKFYRKNNLRWLKKIPQEYLYDTLGDFLFLKFNKFSSFKEDN